MFKIKLLILLSAVSFFLAACSSNSNLESKNNNVFEVDYIAGEFDGLYLKNQLISNLKSFEMYQVSSNLRIKANITHGQSLYVTNIDNTSDREKISSKLEVVIEDKENQCKVYAFDKEITQFYLIASSSKSMSNTSAINKIKKDNTNFLVRDLINDLQTRSLRCNEQ